MAKHIHINFDNVLEIVQKGVRRASIFMGFGVNAALDGNFKSYQLSHITHIQLVPENVAEETLRHFKEEFQIWIEAAGLRELTETFAIYLDAVHEICTVMDSVRTKKVLDGIEQKKALFNRKSFREKLGFLAEKFNVRPNHPDFLISLTRARNCLTHRLGVVGVKDLNGGNELLVRWSGIDYFAVTPTGERHDLNAIPEGGIPLPNGANVMVEFVERSRAFKIGTKVALSTRELAEICWYFNLEAQKIVETARAFAKSLGIPERNSGEG